MAVEAQFLCDARSPDVCGLMNQLMNSRSQRSLEADELQMIPPQMFSDPQSQQTCIPSAASRKRARDERIALFARQSGLTDGGGGGGDTIPGVPTACCQVESCGAASTSGRLALPSLSHDLVSLLSQQEAEIDALARFHMERLRSGLQEARKRQCRTLLLAWEQQSAKRLMEKEAKLEAARQRNAELEEKLRQASAESQLWFNVAKSNDAVVCGLRASLEQALLQNAAGGADPEGFGDSEGDEAQSCCFEPEGASLPARACRACGGRDVCLLLLPCKHLCLCKECEPDAIACPVCGAAKNAYLQVFLC